METPDDKIVKMVRIALQDENVQYLYNLAELLERRADLITEARNLLDSLNEKPAV